MIRSIFIFAQVIASGQLEDMFAADGGIELPVEVFPCLEGAKLSGFGAAVQHPLVATIEFVLENDFEILTVAVADGRRGAVDEVWFGVESWIFLVWAQVSDGFDAIDFQ
jgi:hypothetical protein